MGGKGGSPPAPPPVPDTTAQTEEFMKMMLPMFQEMNQMMLSVASMPAPEMPALPPQLDLPQVEPYTPVDWEAEYKKLQDKSSTQTKDELTKKNTADKTILTSPLLEQEAEKLKTLLGENSKTTNKSTGLQL